MSSFSRAQESETRSNAASSARSIVRARRAPPVLAGIGTPGRSASTLARPASALCGAPPTDERYASRRPDQSPLLHVHFPVEPIGPAATVAQHDPEMNDLTGCVRRCPLHPG